MMISKSYNSILEMAGQNSLTAIDSTLVTDGKHLVVDKSDTGTGDFVFPLFFKKIILPLLIKEDGENELEFSISINNIYYLCKKFVYFDMNIYFIDRDSSCAGRFYFTFSYRKGQKPDRHKFKLTTSIWQYYGSFHYHPTEEVVTYNYVNYDEIARLPYSSSIADLNADRRFARWLYPTEYYHSLLFSPFFYDFIYNHLKINEETTH